MSLRGWGRRSIGCRGDAVPTEGIESETASQRFTRLGLFVSSEETAETGSADQLNLS